MARFQATVESGAALAGGANIATIMAASGTGFKVRKVRIGVFAGTSTPTSQQITVQVQRVTARGTATTTKSFQQMDPNLPVSAITGLDTAWSVNPTLTGTILDEYPFNSLAGWELPYEALDELVVAAGAGNGLAFVNANNALPPSHKFSLTVCEEE